ncbi:MAG: hypothetical protein IT379_29550 [Deltaproteobacteria bacterium]|nr:hypothetical protein [Deltaproteobacteria bacterium]
MAKPRKPRARTSSKTVPRLAALAERAEKAKAIGAKNARALVARIRRLQTRIAEDFYDLALCFHELDAKRHWAALGYTSFDACVAKEKLFDPEGARQMVAIIDARVSRDAAIALGSYSAAYEALQLTKATRALDTVDGLVERDASVGGTKIVGSSVRTLRATRRRIAGAGGVAPAVLSSAEKLAETITRELERRASIDVTARVEPALSSARVVVTLDLESAKRFASWLKKVDS